MEDASAITSLPDDPQALKQIIINLSRERDEHRQMTERFQQRVDELEVAKLRLEMEVLRLKKWYYGPRADGLQTAGDVAQMLLTFATELQSRPVNPNDLQPNESLPEVGTLRRVRRGRRNLAALENLPVIRKEHDLPEDQKTCPCCGEMRRRIGEETSWQAEFIPGHFSKRYLRSSTTNSPFCRRRLFNSSSASLLTKRYRKARGRGTSFVFCFMKHFVWLLIST
jgi:transposase